MDKDHQRGAIIVEATLALPFFMFAIFTLLSVVQIAYTQARIHVALDSATKQVAEYAHIYYVMEMPRYFSGSGGVTSDISGQVADFLEGLGGQLGNINEEAGQFVTDAGEAIRGDNLVAIVQNLAGSAIVKQIFLNNLANGPGDTGEAFLKRNRVTKWNFAGSKFMQSGETGSDGKDIFMRVNYEVQVVRLLGIRHSFKMSHCAYAHAWAGEGEK